MAVTDEAIEKIKQMLVSGELGPGDRLPPEQELSTRLGLSRSSLREAVKALELLRILDVRRGDGTYVTSLEPRLLMEAASFVVDLHRDSSVLELFAVRRILEPAAVAMATERATQEDVARLRVLLDDVSDQTVVDDLVAHDLRFHHQLCALSGNDYLTSLLDSLSGKTVRARVWRGLTEDHAVQRTLTEHAAIVDAVAAGDADLARSLATAHIAGVERWLRTALP